MKKLITILILSLLTNFQICYPMKAEIKKEVCFSKSTFDSVYDFILMKTQKDKTKGYVFGDWEIVLNDISEIVFKQNGYTLSKINREFGIFSFAKYNLDNERNTLKTNQLFCELLLLAKNYKDE